jgi:hypothetical protein
MFKREMFRVLFLTNILVSSSARLHKKCTIKADLRRNPSDKNSLFSS